MSSEARRIAVVSGKGGVGKTNLVANVAVAAAGLGAKVLVVDGDLGLANVDVLLGLAPKLTAADVIEGRCRFEDALLTGPRGIHILPAASGRSDLPGFRPERLAGLLIPFFEASEGYDLVLVDTGAGVGPAVISMAAACDLALLVVTSEPTSLADAYATLKVLLREAPSLRVEVLVNHVPHERAGREEGAMDPLDQLRLGQTQQIVVALQIARVVRKAFAPEMSLLEAVLLDHCTHGAVEQDDLALEQRAERTGVGHRGYRAVASHTF